MRDVPIDRCRLICLQKPCSNSKKAERVSGSDLSDQHLATLVLYADGVEVDKRTNEYLRQVERAAPGLAVL